MKRLTFIFGVALFLCGCASDRVIITNVSYAPADYPAQVFSLKDKRPTLYIDSVVDKREFTLEKSSILGGTIKTGRFKEDSTIYYQMDDHLIPGPVNHQHRYSKTPSKIIREALETEVRRFGIKIVKDRGLANGILKASIKKFNIPEVSKISFPRINSVPIIKVHLELYQGGFDDIVWEGTIKGSPSFLSQRLMSYEEGLNSALSMAIKQWYNYPGFKDALVNLSGNVPFPPSSQEPPKAVQSFYSGTGFLFSAKDYVITNWHVVRGTNNIKVKFLNGEKIKAEVALKDPQNDIAFLKLTREPKLPPSNLKIGDSSNMKMGDKVFTIGYPAHFLMGVNPKYTEGVVNAISGLKDDPTVFQISVQIQPGNSGGPLFNSSGEVIGITQSSLDPKVAIGALGTLPQNVNYAIKSSYISALLPMLPETLIASRGILVVPTEPENTLSHFIEKAKKNIVLIEAKE